MDNNFVSEMVGTGMLILFGDGVVAAVLLHRSKAENGGWIVITTGWAMAVMIGVFAATYSGGLINPAVTIGFAVAGDLDWADVPALLARLLAQGYHAGLPLGRWYPALGNCVSLAVTEQRTRAEIDGLVAAYAAEATHP